MNDLLVALGIEAWKPVLGALVMPPVPFLLMVLVGARLMFRRRLLAWGLISTAVLGLWLSCTLAVSSALHNALLMPPRALSPNEIADLRKAPKTAIVVLGGGRRLLSPEYGVSNLSAYSMERLRFGMWLAKETSLPVLFSGGVGHGAEPGPSEAEIASRIAEREFGRTLRWTEGVSRDTNENAVRTLEMLKPEGIERVVLVTHGFHMRRAQAAFARASERTGLKMEVVAAPMGLFPAGRPSLMDWLPTDSGFTGTRIALHEWLGRLAGA